MYHWRRTLFDDESEMLELRNRIVRRILQLIALDRYEKRSSEEDKTIYSVLHSLIKSYTNLNNATLVS